MNEGYRALASAVLTLAAYDARNYRRVRNIRRFANDASSSMALWCEIAGMDIHTVRRYLLMHVENKKTVVLTTKAGDYRADTNAG